MKNIHKEIIEFIENEAYNKELEMKLTNFLENQNIFSNQLELKEILHLILNIFQNHQKSSNFNEKIEIILSSMKNEIQKYFSNFEIFNIFKSSKRILLFLFEQKILIPDKLIYDILKNDQYERDNYIQYFYPEFELFLSADEIQNFKKIEENFELFEQKRKIGENDSYICHLIRNDLINEFISYTNQTNYSLQSEIPKSIFETNSFLLHKSSSLIEYSAFFGSIQIFKYLYMNNVSLVTSLWMYSIHGHNPELFHFLEDNKLQLRDDFRLECLYESIKCHNIKFTEYIKDILLDNQSEEDLYDLLKSIESDQTNEESNNEIEIFSKSLKYFNYFYLQADFINESTFYKLCKYDYCHLVQILIKNDYLNINTKNIFI